MVHYNDSSCPSCGGSLYFYDKVKRIVKLQNGIKKETEINRVRCKSCRKTHRVIPDDIIPYKHYAKDIVQGVLRGEITSELLDFEDFPCDMTMKRWLYTQQLQWLL